MGQRGIGRPGLLGPLYSVSHRKGPGRENECGNLAIFGAYQKKAGGGDIVSSNTSYLYIGSTYISSRAIDYCAKCGPGKTHT